MVASISFLTNTGGSHENLLLKLFKQADEIIFAVGFLKKSGFQKISVYLKEFCDDKTKSSTFYIGTGLGETDPEALLGLHNILKSKANHQLILCTPDAGIFHPKIYIFKSGEKVTIITGSSNLTHHGWVINDEVSMVVETTANFSEFEQLNSYLDQLYKKHYSDDVERLILRYKDEIGEYQEKYGSTPAFRFRRKQTTIDGIDLPMLKGYYEEYKKDKKWFVEPEEREEEYKKAKELLEELASTKPLNDNQFHELFGPLVGHKEYKPKLWHSGSIHRKTHKTLQSPDSFRDIVREVKLNISKPIPEVYDNAITFLNKLRQSKKISGVGGNIVTEILLSYNPEKFANLNKNPIKVLELVGKKFPSISSFKGEDYEEYVTLLGKIKDGLEMNSFLEIDSFFNYVYWILMDK